MIRRKKHSNTLFVLLFLTYALFITSSCTSKVTKDIKSELQIQLKTIDKGYYAGISGSEISLYAIDNGKDFARLFKKIHSRNIPAPPPPSIDFSKNVVIAAIHGERPTGGYSFSIDKQATLSSDGVLSVKIISKKPPAGSMLTQAFTNPYEIVSLSLSKKKISKVHFKDGRDNILKITSLNNSH